jgi:hypothetical protein
MPVPEHAAHRGPARALIGAGAERRRRRRRGVGTRSSLSSSAVLPSPRPPGARVVFARGTEETGSLVVFPPMGRCVDGRLGASDSPPENWGDVRHPPTGTSEMTTTTTTRLLLRRVASRSGGAIPVRACRFCARAVAGCRAGGLCSCGADAFLIGHDPPDSGSGGESEGTGRTVVPALRSRKRALAAGCVRCLYCCTVGFRDEQQEQCVVATHRPAQ